MIDLEELLDSYEKQLTSIKSQYNPYTSCCDNCSIMTQEHEMERIIKDLKVVIENAKGRSY